MGLFDKIKNAKAGFNSVWEGPNHSFQIVDRVKEGTTRPPGARPFVAIEKRIIHVFDGEHAQGTEVCHMLMADQDSFDGNFKGFVMGVTGCADEEVTSELCEQIIGKGNPLGGLVIECKAHNIVTRAGNPFTKVSYMRNVTPEELRETLSDDQLRTFFFEDRDLAKYAGWYSEMFGASASSG